MTDSILFIIGIAAFAGCLAALGWILENMLDLGGDV